MFKKGLFFFGSLLILVLIQTSFLPCFYYLWFLNLPLIFLVWLLVFKEDRVFIYPAAIWTGFWLDLFSDSFLGASVLILCAETFILKKVLRNFKKQNFLFFLIFLLLFTLIYYAYGLLIRLVLKRF